MLRVDWYEFTNISEVCTAFIKTAILIRTAVKNLKSYKDVEISSNTFPMIEIENMKNWGLKTV
jgi:hypothetical protein